MSKAIVVLSGGQDSTTCLYWAKERFDVHTITFDYGQKHAVEIKSAQRIAKFAGVSNDVINIPTSFLSGTSQLTTGEPSLYANANALPGGIAKTFVPLRNQLFLTLAANRAYCMGASHIVTGLCQSDYSGYPDCRQVFVDALEQSFNLGTFTGEPGTQPPVRIHTPLMDLTKRDISIMSLTGDPHCYSALAWSHTAYTGGLPTDTDAASLLRARGFEEADIPDPLVLRLWQAGWIEQLPKTNNYRIGLIDRYSQLAMEFTG